MIIKLLRWLLVGKVTVYGDLPEGNFVYIFNHPSWRDVFVINAVLPEARIMANPTVYKYAGFILRHMNAYPITPSWIVDFAFPGDPDSIALCPEGWCDLTGKVGKFKTGFAVISRISGKPVVPCKIYYRSYRGDWINKYPALVQWVLDLLLPRKHNVNVLIGTPIQVNSIEIQVPKIRELYENSLHSNTSHR